MAVVASAVVAGCAGGDEVEVCMSDLVDGWVVVGGGGWFAAPVARWVFGELSVA